MNWKLLLPSALLSTMFVCSCETSSGPGGTVVNNPSVDDIARLESQWGLKPRQVKPRLRPIEPGDLQMNQSTSPSSTPAPAPAPAPAPETSAVAPLKEPETAPVGTVDPATIQKLR